MIVKIDWKTFQAKILRDRNAIYVLEDDFYWDFYAIDGIVVINTKMRKMENVGERVNFVDLYLTGLNIIKCDSINTRMD